MDLLRLVDGTKPGFCVSLGSAVLTCTVLAALLVTARPARGADEQPPLQTLLDRAGAYVARYAKTFKDVVAEEDYRQSWQDPRNSALTARALRSDMVFAVIPGPLPWTTFRDVYEVDGNEVRAREARLERLFTKSARSALEQAHAVLRESSRYNVGPRGQSFHRTINVPTLCLLFLQPENQARLSFDRKGRRSFDGLETVEVKFKEKARPTLIRDSRGNDIPALGRFWIAPSRGIVLRTEVEYNLQPGVPGRRHLAFVSTRYRREPGLDIYVPSEMKEWYKLPTGRIECTARYSNFRRFKVTTEATNARTALSDTGVPPPIVIGVDLEMPPNETSAAPATGPSESGLDFPTEVDLVVVDAVVLDAEHQPVTGLTLEDFVLSEDGRPQVITSFHRVEAQEGAASAAPGRPSASVNTGTGPTTTGTFVIFYDDLNLSQEMGYYARQAISEVLLEHVREGDVVTLIRGSEAAWWSSRMLEGRAGMLSLVEKEFGGRKMSRAAPSRLLQTQAALELALIAQADTPGRKSLILISGGFPSETARSYEKRMLRAARLGNVAVYFVNARALSGWNADFAAADERWRSAATGHLGKRSINIGQRRSRESAGSETLASRTGGFTIQNNNDLAGAVQRVFAENRNYYLLGYRSSNPKRDGRFRTIEVRVGRKGLKVRARKGYYAPTNDTSP